MVCLLWCHIFIHLAHWANLNQRVHNIQFENHHGRKFQKKFQHIESPSYSGS